MNFIELIDAYDYTVFVHRIKYLKLPLRNFFNSSSVTLEPGRLTMKALGSSPASSSGMPITAVSDTSGCVSNMCSNSDGETCFNAL